jgi:hypothetical protein
MDDLIKKPELTEAQKEQVIYILSRKAGDWYMYKGHEPKICELLGIEVFRTQDEGIYVIKDVETGIMIGMKRDVENDGVVTRISFFSVNAEDLKDADDVKDVKAVD